MLLAAPHVRPTVAFLAPTAGSSGGQAGLVRVAHLNGRHFRAPQTISAAGESERALGAAGPNGIILTWIRRDSSNGLGTVLTAPSNPTTGQLESPQQVSPSEQAGGAASAYDSTAKHWIIAWWSRPQSADQTVVRVSSEG